MPGRITKYIGAALALWLTLLLAPASAQSGAFSITLSVPASGPAVSGITLRDLTSGSTLYTNDRTVSVEAGGVSGSPVGMALSGEAAFAGAGWENYANPTTFEVSAGDGTKEVYYKLRNAALTESSTVSATIVLDQTAPTVDLITPEGGGGFGAFAGPAAITWSASDAFGLAAGPISLYFSSDSGSNWSAIASDLANTGQYSWSLPAVDSSNCRVRVEARDLATNVGTAASTSSFTIDAATPEASLVSAATDLPLTGEAVISFSEAVKTASVASRFSISPAVAGSLAWSSGDTVLTFNHPSPFDYETAYTITISNGATDLYDNPMPEQTFSFTTVRRDAVPPEIAIKIADLAVKSGDYIDREPEFEVVMTDNLSLDASSVKVYFADAAVTYFIKTLTDTLIELTYSPAALADGTYSIKAEVADVAGNVATDEVTGLQVASGPVTIRDIIVAPMPLKPGSGESAKIAYLLSKDTGLIIYMYSLSGELVWTRRYAAGANGGKAGYNEVEFRGISDLSGAPLANGIYLFKVIADGKVIGKGRTVIYE